MKKHQISISILLSIFVLVLAIIFIRFYNDSQQEENYNSTEEIIQNTKSDSIVANQEYISYMYYIKDDCGRLTVYLAKTEEIYMQTGIETRMLSKELQEKIIEGIFFETDAQLYDFLESYSS